MKKNIGAIITLWFLQVLFCNPTTILASTHTLGKKIPHEINVPDKVHIGDPFSIQISSPAKLKTAQVTWLGEKASMSLDKKDQKYHGSLLLGTDVKKTDAGNKSIEIKLANSDCSIIQKRNIHIKSRSFPVQRLQLPPSEVSISDAALQRHKREKKQVNKALHTYSRERFWDCPFVSPVPGKVTSVYGLKRFLNNKPRSPHRGMDFSAKRYRAIQATNTGEVVLTGEHFFAGKSVYIHHGQGVVSMYFHLSRIDAEKGQMLQKGDIVGLCGKTGRVTASHLHFGISILGQLVNPDALLETNCPITTIYDISKN